MSLIGSDDVSWKQDYSYYKSVFAQENQKQILRELERTRSLIKMNKERHNQSDHYKTQSHLPIVTSKTYSMMHSIKENKIPSGLK